MGVILIPGPVSGDRTQQGFDDFGERPWQMVPCYGYRELIVTGADGLRPRVKNDLFVRVRQRSIGRNQSMVRVNGSILGSTQIGWQDPSVDHWQPEPGYLLDVSVKKHRYLKVAFHFVSAGARQRTSRTPGDVRRIIMRANDIIGPQANTTIKVISASSLNIAKNMGDVFTIPDSGEVKRGNNLDLLFRQADRKADVNVYFVKEVELETAHNMRQSGVQLSPQQARFFGTDHEWDGFGGIIPNTCIIEDNLEGPVERVFVHELIHALGYEGHVKTPGSLMFAASSSTGQHLDRKAIEFLNPS